MSLRFNFLAVAHCTRTHENTVTRLSLSHAVIKPLLKFSKVKSNQVVRYQMLIKRVIIFILHGLI